MLLGPGAAVLVLGGVRATAWLIGPMFLALIVVIALYPVQASLRRHNWPDWLTTLVLVLLVVGLLACFVLIVVVSLAQLAVLLPQYADRADDLLQSLSGGLSNMGAPAGQLDEAVSSISPDKVVALIGAVLAGLSTTLSSFVFLLCLMLFLSVDAGGIERRLAAVATDRPELETALRSFAHGTRAISWSRRCSASSSECSTAPRWRSSASRSVLWAVLAFITNYIPNVGFLIGLVPPALLALLTLGLPEMLLVIAIYCVLNFVIQSLIQPRYVGDSVGLAMTTTFVALVFWAWLLGPLGALLAIPLTLLVKALLVDADPAARWATAGRSLASEPRPPRRSRVARSEAPVSAAAPRVPAA